MSKPTLKDVADAAGVSSTTASFVLAGKGRITPEIRRKVLETVAELGYQKVERFSSSPRPPKTLGVLFNISSEWVFTYHFIRPILDTIQKFCAEHDYLFVLVPLSQEMTPDQVLQQVLHQQCQGLFALHFGEEALFAKIGRAHV